MATSKQFDSSNGTSFVFNGETVEITRADQPICSVPFSDILEFCYSLPTRSAWDQFLEETYPDQKDRDYFKAAMAFVFSAYPAACGR